MSRRSYSSAKREAEAKPVEFELDGETFFVKPKLPDIAMLDFGAAMVEDATPGQRLAAVHALLKSMLLNDAEWHRFYRLTVANGTDMEILQEIVMDLLPEITGRPTERPSSSPPSSSSTSETSTDASELRVING